MTTTFAPTPEQDQALELFRTGKPLAIEALAGTGKTSTLQLLADDTPRRGLYVAFNKAIVTDAGARMPGTVTCSTAHSLAFRTVGKKFSHRLQSGRMRSDQIARALKIDPFFVRYGSQTKVLQPGYLGGLAMRAINNFCNSADERPAKSHIPYIDGIDLPTPSGQRTFHWNEELRAVLLPALHRAWDDLAKVDGQLPYRHDHYLKTWALGHPTLSADFILFDEAQDASPVMAAVVNEQTHAQIVAVGDSNQAIYEWRGAVDAVKSFVGERTTLTQSFRFGPAIAEQANEILAYLGDVKVRGTDTIASVVAPIAEPDTILCRTNAFAVDSVLAAQATGHRPHLVGGGTEVVSFAKAARDLMETGNTWHPELACFDSWGEVTEYVANDQLGGELRLMVSLVEKYGVPTILKALERMPQERDADVIVSTAHKAKGREWGSVQLAGDFPEAPDKDGEPSTPELRLLYVAVTRAKRELDVSAVGLLNQPDEDDEPLPVVQGDDLSDALALTIKYGTR